MLAGIAVTGVIAVVGECDLEAPEASGGATAPAEPSSSGFTWLSLVMKTFDGFRLA
ncbi:MAG: hypothetical protein ABIS06_00330 [Vicinamibacterales bacterium]